jgi:hypothetical protein
MAFIALMMEAESTSETLVNLYETSGRNIPEDSGLHIRRLEKLKFHSVSTGSSHSHWYMAARSVDGRHRHAGR